MRCRASRGRGRRLLDPFGPGRATSARPRPRVRVGNPVEDVHSPVRGRHEEVESPPRSAASSGSTSASGARAAIVVTAESGAAARTSWRGVRGIAHGSYPECDDTLRRWRTIPPELIEFATPAVRARARRRDEIRAAGSGSLDVGVDANLANQKGDTLGDARRLSRPRGDGPRAAGSAAPTPIAPTIAARYRGRPGVQGRGRGRPRARRRRRRSAGRDAVGGGHRADVRAPPTCWSCSAPRATIRLRCPNRCSSTALVCRRTARRSSRRTRSSPRTGSPDG